jgi:hypothetical protein
MLGAVAHGRHGQHLGPGLEQEITNFLAHRHVLEHGAQLDGVLDGQRLALLDLLGHADARRAWPSVRNLAQLLELRQHQLEHAPPGLGYCSITCTMRRIRPPARCR